VNLQITPTTVEGVREIVLSISTFTCIQDVKPVCGKLTLAEWQQRLTKHSVRETKDGPLYSPAIWEDGYTRGNEGIGSLTCVIFDCEKTSPSFPELQPRLDGKCAIWHTTFQHTSENGRYRLILPLSRPVSLHEFPLVHRGAARYLDIEGRFDPTCREPARAYYAPSCPSEHAHEKFSGYTDGALWDPIELIALVTDEPDPAEFTEDVLRAKKSVGGRPGDDYNQRETWGDVLTRHGWKVVSTRGDTTYWCRPGKAFGISATTNHQGSDLLYVFSSSTSFEPNRGYTKFSAYAILEHGGDFSEAARELAAKGYGEPRVKPSPSLENSSEGDFESPDVYRFFDMSRLTLGSDIAAGDYEVSFVIDKLIPEDASILFYGKGGCGKSTLATQMGAAINEGHLFMGLSTIKRPVVIIDYENPLAVQKRRVEAVKHSGGIYFWTTCNEPPRLDENGWSELKSLITTLEKPVIIIDTLASSCPNSDIADNKSMAPVMKRIIELRNLGATIILLHHSPKGDETKWIGATCIYSQVDHVIAMYPVKKMGDDTEAADDDEVKTYRFGTKDKSRFEHFAMYVVFDEDKSHFVEADDPDNDIIKMIQQEIARNQSVNQSALLATMKSYCPDKKLKRLLKNGEGRFWVIEKGLHNSKIYRTKISLAVWQPQGVNNCQTEKQLSKISSAVLSPLVPPNCQTEISYSENPTKQTREDTPRSLDYHEFGSFSGSIAKLENQPGEGLFSELDDFDIPAEVLNAS
jgi:archaellum biogenesis ATPase FlaH